MPNELDLYTPQTLTEAVNLIIPETFYLTKVLDTGAPYLPGTESLLFDVVTHRRDLAPLGHNGDPATRVDFGGGYKTFTVTPPQIFLEDQVAAGAIAARRMAGQSPINAGSAGVDGIVAALNDYIAEKQQNMVDSIARRIEWMWAQAVTTGKIDYTDSNGRPFSIDYGVPSGNLFTASQKWDASSNAGDPVLQIQQWQRQFAKVNGVKPTVFVLGEAAADAFRGNKAVDGWLKSAGVQVLQINVGTNEDLVTPVGTIPGVGTLVEYGGVFPEGGATKPFIPADCLVMTHPKLWRMAYGAISDFDLGAVPVGAMPRFSKMKDSKDGKSKSLFVESHPLPILQRDTGTLVVKVCGS